MWLTEEERILRERKQGRKARRTQSQGLNSFLFVLFLFSHFHLLSLDGHVLMEHAGLCAKDHIYIYTRLLI